jgi:hypothetical protein
LGKDDDKRSFVAPLHCRKSPQADQRSNAAGDEVGLDQEGDLRLAAIERAADNERRRNGARVPDEHVLDGEESHPAGGKDLVDGRRRAAHRDHVDRFGGVDVGHGFSLA